MELFFDQVLNGISSGVIYASVALALVLIYRTTGLLNFAQGELALFSTFITYWFAVEQGLSIVVSLLLSVAVGFVGGAVIERVLIRPVEGAHSPLNVVIVTLGLFLAVNALAALIFIKPGQEALQMPDLFPNGGLSVSTVDIRWTTVGFAAVLVFECLLLYVLLLKTRLGLALRAVASNPESSRLVGINTGTMLMVGWALAAAIGAVAGSLAATRGSGFDTSLMQQILVYAFAAAALGGFDSPLGAVVGGLVVGIADALTIQYVDALDGIELVVPFVLILVVLLVRPNGLFGRTIVERV
jgi:branched-chain amino acid transport system permease protein